MLNHLFRRLKRFFQKSSTINDQAINRVSLLVIILIDIFILVNVFVGLNDIARWYVSPSQAYACYPKWQSYRNSDAELKEYDIIRSTLQSRQTASISFLENYNQTDVDHLGSVSAICRQYAALQDSLTVSENQEAIRRIDEMQTEVDELESANQMIRQQYDSTLLEELAGQPREQSINTVEAAQAKQELDANNTKIAALKEEQGALQNQLVTSPAGDRFIQFLNDDNQFQTLDRQYDRASFWYPSIQIVFQGFFLVPLILLASVVHRYGQHRGYGLVSLISWHLIIIFYIPLIVKIFEFLQVGILFEVLSEVVRTLLGGLLFLVSYLYILLIPLVGFGLIKLAQRVVFNPRVQAAGRVQGSRCIRCAKKIRPDDSYCPHCGYYQLVECPSCHGLTYQHLPYCRVCGAAQSLARTRV